MFSLIASNGQTLSQNLLLVMMGVLLHSILTHEASLQNFVFHMKTAQTVQDASVKQASLRNSKLQEAATVKSSSSFSPQSEIPYTRTTEAFEAAIFSLTPPDRFTPESYRVIRSTESPNFVPEDKLFPNDETLENLNKISMREELGEKNGGNSSDQYLFSDSSYHSSTHPLSTSPSSSSSYSSSPSSSSFSLSTFSFSYAPLSFTPATKSTRDDLSTSQATEKEINERREPSCSPEKENARPDEEGKVIDREIMSSSEEKGHQSKSTKTNQKEEGQMNDLVEVVEKSEAHKQTSNPYTDNFKENLPLRANNELDDPFLLSVDGILSKNITERISEIVSLKSKPEKFIAMFKAAQQSENFEDPFTLSSLLHESSLDNTLTDDSSGFSERLKKMHQSSFRGLSNEPKQYNIRNKDYPNTDAPSRATIKDEDSTDEQTNPYAKKTSAMASGNMHLDSDVLEVGNRFLESLVHSFNATKEFGKPNSKLAPQNAASKIIYQEISGPLHIDTSIDDIKDDYESHEKTTETSNSFLSRVNTSRVNFWEPEIFITISDDERESVGTASPVANGKVSYSRSQTEKGRVVASSTASPLAVSNQSIPYVTSSVRTGSETTEGISHESASPEEEQRRSRNESSGMEGQDRRSFNKSSFAFVTNGEVLRATQSPKGGERNIEITKGHENAASKEAENDNRYYSFFGYKEKTGSAENLLRNRMSVGDHNEKILSAQAGRMLQVMDSSADPCDDFYEFACGKWSHVYPLEDKALDNTFDRLREGLDEVLKLLLEEPVTDQDSNATKTAKVLYRGCMNEEQIETLGVTPLKTLLRELGGWPVIEGKSWNETAFDWVELMANLRNFNNDILLSEWVAADITNSSCHIIQLDQPELGLPGREYFLSASDQSYRMAYMELMLKTCQLLGATPLTALDDMINVLQFEKQLAKILIPAEERRNLSAVHLRLTVEELQNEIPQVNWNRYFEIVTASSVDRRRYVIVFAMQYIRRLVQLIQTTSKRTVSNYLMWRFVKNRMNNLGTKALEAKQEFIQVLFGSKSQPERWLFCVSYINGNLGHILGALFVQKYYPQSSKNDSEKMIHLIRESFIEAIRETNWMEKKTRQVAEKKVKAMVRNVGYPEYILNNTYMDHVYSQLTFNESDHFWNVIKMLRFHARTSHELLQKPVNRNEWTTTPAVVNAYYSRSKNMIMFPAGILQPPFYHPAFPRCLNFGGIGVVIGHEISHGFDDRGRQFDNNGNLHQWWTEEDVSHFYDRATCMLDQYNDYKIESVGLKINAVNTLGENIADNAGLKIAYKAYQRWRSLHGEETIQLPKLNFSHDQLFFLNFGQIWCEVNSPEAMLTKIRGGQHSPNKYRVIGTLSNSKEFSEAFRCPEGSPMNPKEKCQVW